MSLWHGVGEIFHKPKSEPNFSGLLLMYWVELFTSGLPTIHLRLKFIRTNIALEDGIMDILSISTLFLHPTWVTFRPVKN